MKNIDDAMNMKCHTCSSDSLLILYKSGDIMIKWCQQCGTITRLNIRYNGGEAMAPYYYLKEHGK